MPLLNGMAAVPMIMAQRAALAYRAAASVVINTTDAQLLATAAARQPIHKQESRVWVVAFQGW